MKHIDDARLETDLGYRFEYVAGFIGFGSDDVAAVHGAAPKLAPLVPLLVDAVYNKLYQQDATQVMEEWWIPDALYRPRPESPQ